MFFRAKVSGEIYRKASGKRGAANIPAESLRRSGFLKAISSNTVKAGNQTSAPKWWERVVVGVLLVTAVVYARSAMPGTDGSACSPKMLQTLARIYMAQGDYDKAETLVDKALDVVAPKEDADEEKSSCLIDLGWVYKNQGRFAEAEESCLLGLQLQQKVYYSRHPYIAYTLRILVSIYQAQAKYDQAGVALDRAVAIMRTCHLPDDPVLAPFEVDVARLQAVEGRFDQAEAQYEQALRLISDYYGPEHLYTASVLADIGKLYYLQGRSDQAEQLLSWATEIQQRTYGENHRILVPNWLTMAKIYQRRGDFSQAEQLLTKALLAVETKSGRPHPLKGEVLAAIAELLLDAGRYPEAETACRKAIEFLEKSAGPNNDAIAMVLNCLAKLQIIRGNFEQGYTIACNALTTVETVLGPEHPNAALVNGTVALAQELENRTTVAAMEFRRSAQYSTIVARHLSGIE